MSLKSQFVQYFWSSILSLQALILGFSIAWPSYALKILESEQSPLGFSLSMHQSNLVASIPLMGSLISTPLAGCVCERIGRKRAQILAGLIILLSWCLILMAKSALILLIGRFLSGLGSGLSGVVSFVHLVEITQLSIRGNASAMVALVSNLGILTSYLFGWFFSYEVICYICVTASVMYTLTLCCLKETPVYLLKNGRKKEALASLKFYRGESQSTEEILEEFSYLKNLGDKILPHTGTVTDTVKSNDPEKEMLHMENEFLAEKKENPWKLLWTVDHNRRALIFIITLVVLTISMGMMAVQTYAGTFLAQAVPSLSPNLCSVLLALVFCVTSVGTVIVTNMISRRLLMISTCATASICLAVLGSLLRWSWGPTWLSLMPIAIYCVAFNIGCVNVVIVQLSECFGPDVASTASGIAMCAMCITGFVVLSVFMPVVKYLGMDGVFFIFSGISALNTVFCTFFLKETRHVPIEKVQGMFAEGFLYKKSKEV